MIYTPTATLAYCPACCAVTRRQAAAWGLICAECRRPPAFVGVLFQVGGALYIADCCHRCAIVRSGRGSFVGFSDSFGPCQDCGADIME